MLPTSPVQIKGHCKLLGKLQNCTKLRLPFSILALSILPRLKKKKTKGGARAIQAVVIDPNTHPAGKPCPHEVLVVSYDKSGGPLSAPNTRVMISCACEWHCYYCEVALEKYGASKIIFSNGEKPTVTNPGLRPMVCKHGVAVLRAILEHKL